MHELYQEVPIDQVLPEELPRKRTMTISENRSTALYTRGILRTMTAQKLA